MRISGRCVDGAATDCLAVSPNGRCSVAVVTSARETDPKMKTRLSEIDIIALRGSSAEFGNLMVEETEKWAKVIRAAGIKVE
jgi:hypothetical protein